MCILFMESARTKDCCNSPVRGWSRGPEVAEGLWGGGNALCFECCMQLQWECLDSRAGETLNSKLVHYLYALIKFFLREII